MIVIGDVHGNLKTLKALLAKIPEEEKAKGVCFVGDLIDRGPNSKGVIDLIRKNNYHCVRGNHEDMLLGEYQGVLLKMAYTRGWRYAGLWVLHGGVETIESYQELVEDGCGYTQELFSLDVFEEHVEWIKTLPFYLEFKDIKNDDGRHLVVSHSHICNVWKGLHSKKEGINKTKLLQNLMWDRPYKLKQIPEIYNVIGHTPCKRGPKIRKIYANVDTGCFYKGEAGHFRLTALQFPEMVVYEQENIDMT